MAVISPVKTTVGGVRTGISSVVTSTGIVTRSYVITVTTTRINIVGGAVTRRGPAVDACLCRCSSTNSSGNNESSGNCEFSDDVHVLNYVKYIKNQIAR